MMTTRKKLVQARGLQGEEQKEFLAAPESAGSQLGSGPSEPQISTSRVCDCVRRHHFVLSSGGEKGCGIPQYRTAVVDGRKTDVSQ